MMRRWLRKIYNKKEKSPLFWAALALYHLGGIVIAMEVHRCFGAFQLTIMLGGIGLALSSMATMFLYACLGVWLRDDDGNSPPPPSQKFLTENALQEIEDHISGKSLIDEIEKLRNRFVMHLQFLSVRMFPFLRASQRGVVLKTNTPRSKRSGCISA